MSNLQKIEGFSSLRKDPLSKGVVNVDMNAYNAHQTAKRLAMQQLKEKEALQSDVESMRGEINNIKGELTDIKLMLMQLINKGQ
jgi:hypothetical protein